MKTVRAKINLDTMSKINTFVAVCSRLDCKINLIDGNGYCVSAKSLVGALATVDWNQVFVECDKDIYAYIQDFLAE
jgi:hypothetical protein